VLWTTTGKSRPMTLEEIAETERWMEEQAALHRNPHLEGEDLVPIAGTLLPEYLEERKVADQAESIVAQWHAEEKSGQHRNPTLSFSELGAFTNDVI